MTILARQLSVARFERLLSGLQPSTDPEEFTSPIVVGVFMSVSACRVSFSRGGPRVALAEKKPGIYKGSLRVGA